MPSKDIPTKYTVTPEVFRKLANHTQLFKVIFAAISCCHIRDENFMVELERLSRAIRSRRIKMGLRHIPLKDFIAIVAKSSIGKKYGRKASTMAMLLRSPNSELYGFDMYFKHIADIQVLDINWWTRVWELTRTGVHFKIRTETEVTDASKQGGAGKGTEHG